MGQCVLERSAQFGNPAAKTWTFVNPSPLRSMVYGSSLCLDQLLWLRHLVWSHVLPEPHISNKLVAAFRSRRNSRRQEDAFDTDSVLKLEVQRQLASSFRFAEAPNFTETWHNMSHCSFKRKQPHHHRRQGPLSLPAGSEHGPSVARSCRSQPPQWLKAKA